MSTAAARQGPHRASEPTSTGARRGLRASDTGRVWNLYRGLYGQQLFRHRQQHGCTTAKSTQGGHTVNHDCDFPTREWTFPKRECPSHRAAPTQSMRPTTKAKTDKSVGDANSASIMTRAMKVHVPVQRCVYFSVFLFSGSRRLTNLTAAPNGFHCTTYLPRLS
jgi:hypothetical protein